jgi:sugar phosphate permease
MSDAATDRRHQLFAVVTAFLALFAIVGFALYGLPRFYPFYVQELGWTRQQVTSGNAYSKVAVAVAFGFLAGRLVDRFGPRRLMLVGIIMAGGALVGLASVKTMTAFYFFYCFNALGYVFGGPLPNQVLLSRWFDRARGRAMGVAYLGIGLGGAIVPLLAYTLTQRYGWRGALQILGWSMIAVALPAAYFVKEPFDSQALAQDKPFGSHGLAQGKPARQAAGATAGGTVSGFSHILRQAPFYFLALGSMASIGAVGGTVQNLALYLSLDRKLPQRDVDGMLSLVLIGSLIGRLLMGWLADRWPRKRVMLLIYLIVAVAIPPLFFAPTTGALSAAALLFGIGLGGDYMIIPLMAADLYGLAVMGRVMGVVLTADSVAEALVPMLVAGIRDRTGSYEGGFLLLVVLAAIGAVAVSFLPRPAAQTRTAAAPTAS